MRERDLVIVGGGPAGMAAALAARVPGISAIYPGSDFAYSLMPWLGLSGLYFRFRTQAKKKHAQVVKENS